MTIVEPGGARTEFRYGSAQVAELCRRLRRQPGACFLAMLDPANGPALGDPARMAARIIDSVDTEPAPLRLVLGSQALDSTLASCASASRFRGAARARRIHRLPARRVTSAALPCRRAEVRHGKVAAVCPRR